MGINARVLVLALFQFHEGPIKTPSDLTAVKHTPVSIP